MTVRAYANVSIYDGDTKELIHFERVYSEFGPECAVHQEAATLYNFFAEDGRNIQATVEAYCEDIFQQWNRFSDETTFKMTFTNENRPNWKLDN